MAPNSIDELYALVRAVHPSWSVSFHRYGDLERWGVNVHPGEGLIGNGMGDTPAEAFLRAWDKALHSPFDAAAYRAANKEAA